ncbi:MAG: hypothetical protein KKB50_13430, partial [Planctomycetes bacterium]|nr:hypothetical protein [Planctomycetota bacterium]
MIRNIVLLVSSIAILLILFAGYALLVRDPVLEPEQRDALLKALPAEVVADPEEVVQIGPATIPPGGQFEFTVYDERTGRPTDRFRAEEWRPVANSRNEIYVRLPELTILLPSGMLATISADEGQITVDRIQKSRMKPKLGWLRGAARIVIDRATDLDRPPLDQRPADRITVEMERLDFDLELGKLNTDGRLRTYGADFDISGTGLALVWNQVDNRVETLVISEGKELTLFAGSGLFGGLTGRRARPQGNEAPPTTQPRRKRPRRITAYECVLSGGVVAEHWRSAVQLGGLEARELRLLFDVGGSQHLLGQRPTTSAPATRPDEQTERLLVRWQGPLSLGPASSPADVEEPRRRLEATGSPVTLTRGDGTLRCGRLAFQDETQQIWLYRGPDGHVSFDLGPRLNAVATSVYIDNANSIIKLIGDVVLTSRGDEQAGEEPLSIHCTQWAELRVAATASDDALTAENPADLGQLESATFFGDVVVDLRGQRLATHQLELDFEPTTAGHSLEASLESAVASGGVTLAGDKQTLECAQLELAFALSAQNRLYTREILAMGAVRITDGSAYIQGARVHATAAPALAATTAGGPPLILRTLDVSGAAELHDPDEQVAARGEHIAAIFAGANQLARATVSGTPAEPAQVHAEPYTVEGEQIKLEVESQSLNVAGPSRLAFTTTRSLQGQQRRQPLPIVVTSAESLSINGLENRVDMVGNVVARSGDERLRAHSLELLLKDVATADATPAVATPFEALARQAYEQFFGPPAAPQQRDWFAQEGTGRTRKEPVFLTAAQAIVESESYIPGDELPLVHSSIAAPQLKVDILNRLIQTSGKTTLLMTNR